MSTQVMHHSNASLAGLAGKGEFISIPRRYLKFRRMVELLFVILLLPLILLTCLLIACVVAIDSRGSILFTQTRPGRHGRLFKMVKFRTMYRNSSQDQLTVEKDHRITRIGKHLRKYRLDEIPQFWNVLTGEMSIIGPRPIPYNFYKIYREKLPGYDARHLIRPGITGLAQVQMGYTNTIDEEQQKLRYDLLYIKTISLKTDVEIIWNTVWHIVNGRK